MRRVRPTGAEAARHRARPLAGLARPGSAGSIASSAAAAAYSPDPKKTAKPAAYLAAAVEYRRRRRNRDAPSIAPKTPSRAPGSVPESLVRYETIPSAVTPALLQAAADAPECKSCAVTNKKSLEWIAAQQRRAFAEMDAEFAAERAKANPLAPAAVVVAAAAESKKSRAPTASRKVEKSGTGPSSSSNRDSGDADHDTAVADTSRTVKKKEGSSPRSSGAATGELRLGAASRVAEALMRDLVAELGDAKSGDRKSDWVRRLDAWSRVDRATPLAKSGDDSSPNVAVARLHAALLRAECALAFTSPTVRAYDGANDAKGGGDDDDDDDATYSDVCRARYLCGELTPHLASASVSSIRSVARRSAELALAIGKLDPARLQRATSRHVDAKQLAARLASAREFVRDAVASASSSSSSSSETDGKPPSFHERVVRRLGMLVYLHHAVASVARSEAAVASVHQHWRQQLAALVKIERGAGGGGGALEWHAAARPVIDSYATVPVSTF